MTLNPVTPFPIDADPDFDDLADAILDSWGKPAVWKPQDGSAHVPLRAYVRRASTRQESFGRVFTASAKVSALVAAADVAGILQGDGFETLGVDYEVGEVLPDGSAFVRLPLREPGK